MNKQDAKDLIHRAVDAATKDARRHMDPYHSAEMYLLTLPERTVEAMMVLSDRLGLFPRAKVGKRGTIAYLTEVIGDLASDALKPQTEDMCAV